MSPQDVLDLCRDLGLEIRAEEGNLVVSPADKLPATLRDQLREQKEALLEVLTPQSFDNPRGKLRQLEKSMSVSGPEPEVPLILIIHRGHAHSKEEIRATERRLEQAALARWRETGEAAGGVFHVGLDNPGGHCVACRAGTKPSELQEAEQ